MAVQATLVYTAGDGNKQDLVLRVGEDTTIGRHPNCSLTISQPSVSRRHARLWFDQGVWFVEDLQSSNGTFVNNRRINRAQLTEGDELRCGDFLLTYLIEEKTRAVPTPERREKAPSAPPSPNVSNRATIGIESPPPIPEAPRLGAPQPPTPAAPVQAETPFNDDRGRISELETALETARRGESEAQEDLSACREQLEVSRSDLSESKDEIIRLNAQLQSVRNERDRALQTTQNLEEQNQQLGTEVANLNDQNRSLDATIQALRSELNALKESAASTPEVVAASNDEMERLQAVIEARNQEIATLQDQLDALALNANTNTQASRVSTNINAEATEALSEYSSDLRVALKAASGFVQEVKDVFTSVSSMKATSKSAKSVLEVQDMFDEIGGMDPVTSLEIAFDKMEKTARQLRRLSKSL